MLCLKRVVKVDVVATTSTASTATTATTGTSIISYVNKPPAQLTPVVIIMCGLAFLPLVIRTGRVGQRLVAHHDNVIVRQTVVHPDGRARTDHPTPAPALRLLSHDVCSLSVRQTQSAAEVLGVHGSVCFLRHAKHRGGSLHRDVVVGDMLDVIIRVMNDEVAEQPTLVLVPRVHAWLAVAREVVP